METIATTTRLHETLPTGLPENYCWEVIVDDKDFYRTWVVVKLKKVVKLFGKQLFITVGSDICSFKQNQQHLMVHDVHELAQKLLFKVS